jgi:polyphosphate kinase
MVLMMNALVDLEMSKLLYRASQAGVSVDLIVRGMCILRPGVAGVSDNIRVRSIVGRFLEHPRIFHFENDGDPVVLIGSADLMRRNLDRRVEVLAPVIDPVHRAYLRQVVLQTYLDDNVKAREMHADGTYTRVVPAEGAPRIDAQARLLRLSAEREECVEV